MEKMNYQTYLQIAQYAHEYVLNAIDAYFNGDLANCKYLIKLALNYLHDANFFAYITKNDFDNNGMEYDAYNPQIIETLPNDALFFVGDNDFNYKMQIDCISNMNLTNSKMSLHSSNSIIITIFGFCLGAKLNQIIGV